ncbi:hypothetical protein RJ641_020064 [Dillenia turbinata]|uniref:Uncharacterized protein n=1 Tax=Dillenia turbinata TaxID=194707 RepID=A0AAN8UQT3_9MAGN
MGEKKETKSGESKNKTIEPKPRSGVRRIRLRTHKILFISNVLNGGESKRKTLRQLNPTNDRQRNELIEERHEAGGAKDEEDAGGADAGGGDLGDCEVGRGLGGGDGCDGLHGLDRHGDVEEEASSDVVERCEDKGSGEVKVVDECES